MAAGCDGEAGRRGRGWGCVRPADVRRVASLATVHRRGASFFPGRFSLLWRGCSPASAGVLASGRHLDGSSMSSMMNPLVRARFGNYTKGEAVQSTPPVRGNSKNNAGRNADFTTLPNNQNTLWVPRQPNDQGLCVIECWNKAKGPERCIGQCVVDVQDYIGLLQDGDVPAAGDNAEGGAEGGGVANGGAASPGRPLEHDLILLDQLPDFEALATRSPDRGGISERSQAGILNVKIKWSPPDMEAAKEEGHLVVQVVAVKELRDISGACGTCAAHVLHICG